MLWHNIRHSAKEIKPLATMPENGHFGHFDHFQAWSPRGFVCLDVQSNRKRQVLTSILLNYASRLQQ